MGLCHVCRGGLRLTAFAGALAIVVSSRAVADTITLKDASNGLAAAIARVGPGGTVRLVGTIREAETVTIRHKVKLLGVKSRGQLPTLIIQPTDGLNALAVLA